MGPVPSVGLTLTWFIWDKNLAFHVTLTLFSYGLSSLFSCVSANLRNALPGFIRTFEFTGFKRESRDAFCTAAFLFNEYIFKYYVFSRYLYMLCILAVNVMSRRVIRKFEMK